MSDTSKIFEAARLAFTGALIGDAAAMPVHWYYDVPAIKRDYNGWITQYEKPHRLHPKSFMKLPEGGENPPLVGHVILHNKLDYWTSSEYLNYHCTMESGENTLNCQCALLIMKSLRQFPSSMNDEEVLKQIFKEYVEFMTTPDSYTDSYAESYHRSFFGDWVKAGKPTELNALHNFVTKRSETAEKAAYIGALGATTAIILYFIDRPVDEVISIALKFVKRTHRDETLMKTISNYPRILHSVVRGGSLRDAAEKALIDHFGSGGEEKIRKYDEAVEKADDKLSAYQAIGKELGIACDVKGAWPIALLICRNFHDDFEGGILTNVNIGGDNVGRGSPVGAMLGAAAAWKGKIPKKWLEGLKYKSQFAEILSK
ncbi:uncharacterized protein LOC143448458 [Clavelina lepadiformis]|uniref:uncharacterized protein LOC143448458 n=1 Tax=Clavelina lepadiformis TaxID=159417 RepID=UPI0040438FDC